MAPADAGPATVVGLLIAVALAVSVLHLAVQPLLRGLGDTQRRVLRWSVAVCFLAALGFGWISIGVPAIAERFLADAVGYQFHISQVSAVLHGADLTITEALGSFASRRVFLLMMGGAQAVFGTSGYVTVVVNALLAGLCLLVVVDTTRLLVRHEAPAIHTNAPVTAGVMVALLPAMPIWSGTPLREVLVALLVLASLDVSVRLADRLHPGWFVGNLVVLAILQFTRPDPVPPLVVALLLALVLGARRSAPYRAGSAALRAHVGRSRGASLTAGGLAIAGAGVVLLAASLLAPRTNQYLWWFAEHSRRQFGVLNEMASTATRAPAAFDTVLPGVLDLLVRLPGALARGLWAPGPLSWGRASPIFALDAFSLWLLTPLVVVGIVAAARARRQPALVVLLFAFGWLAISGYVLGNYGIISRLRLPGWLALLPLAGWGWAWWWQDGRWLTDRRQTSATGPTDPAMPRPTSPATTDGHQPS